MGAQLLSLGGEGNLLSMVLTTLLTTTSGTP
jgi:hypothetical protein